MSSPAASPVAQPLYVGMDRYSKLELLGSGAYAKVYKAKDKQTNEIVALKQFKAESDKEGIHCSSLREIATLKELQHPNVIIARDVVHDDNKLCLVLEYMEADLKYYLASVGKPLDGLLVASYLSQLLTGLAHCHGNRVLHRDLKPDNLLINKNGVLKLADFGQARSIVFNKAPLTVEMQTMWYRAPELLLGNKQYGTAIDVWSVGCIFAEMMTRVPLFRGDSDIDQLFRIFRTVGTPTEDTWPGVSKLPDFKCSFPEWSPRPLVQTLKVLEKEPLALDLLERMLVCDPSKRISAQQALSHPYFDELNAQKAKKDGQISKPAHRSPTHRKSICPAPPP